MMFVVVNFHRLRVDIRFQRVESVRQWWQFESRRLCGRLCVCHFSSSNSFRTSQLYSRPARPCKAAKFSRPVFYVVIRARMRPASDEEPAQETQIGNSKIHT